MRQGVLQGWYLVGFCDSIFLENIFYIRHARGMKRGKFIWLEFGGFEC